MHPSRKRNREKAELNSPIIKRLGRKRISDPMPILNPVEVQSFQRRITQVNNINLIEAASIEPPKLSLEELKALRMSIKRQPVVALPLKPKTLII